MRKLKLAVAKAKFSELVTEAEYKGERVLVQKRDKPVAVIMGYAEYKQLEALEDLVLSGMLEAVLKKGKFHSLEEVAKRLKIGV
jgi:prevent-host-death family protein